MLFSALEQLQIITQINPIIFYGWFISLIFFLFGFFVYIIYICIIAFFPKKKKSILYKFSHIKLIILYIYYFGNLNQSLILYFLCFIIQIYICSNYGVLKANPADLLLADIEAASLKKEAAEFNLAIKNIKEKLDLDELVYNFLSSGFSTKLFFQHLVVENQVVNLEGYSFNYEYLNEKALQRLLLANREVNQGLLNIKLSENAFQKVFNEEIYLLNQEKLLRIEQEYRRENSFSSIFFKILSNFGLCSNLESLDSRLEQIENNFLQRIETMKENYFSFIREEFAKNQIILNLEEEKIKEDLKKADFHFFCEEINKTWDLYEKERLYLHQNSEYNPEFYLSDYTPLDEVQDSLLKEDLLAVHANELYVSALKFEPFLNEDSEAQSTYMSTVSTNVKKIVESPEFIELLEEEKILIECSERFCNEYYKSLVKILKKKISDEEKQRKYILVFEKIKKENIFLISNLKFRWLNILISLNSRK